MAGRRRGVKKHSKQIKAGRSRQFCLLLYFILNMFSGRFFRLFFASHALQSGVTALHKMLNSKLMGEGPEKSFEKSYL